MIPELEFDLPVGDGYFESKVHIVDGKFHRVDGPAIVDYNGNQFWYQYGKRHRKDGPAVIWSNGTKHWYQYGKRHREDGPAIMEQDGSQEYYLNNHWLNITNDFQLKIEVQKMRRGRKVTNEKRWTLL